MRERASDVPRPRARPPSANGPTSGPRGSGNGSPSPTRSPTTRHWCSPTSRPAAWIPEVEQVFVTSTKWCTRAQDGVAVTTTQHGGADGSADPPDRRQTGKQRRTTRLAPRLNEGARTQWRRRPERVLDRQGVKPAELERKRTRAATELEMAQDVERGSCGFFIASKRLADQGVRFSSSLYAVYTRRCRIRNSGFTGASPLWCVGSEKIAILGSVPSIRLPPGAPLLPGDHAALTVIFLSWPEENDAGAMWMNGGRCMETKMELFTFALVIWAIYLGLASGQRGEV